MMDNFPDNTLPTADQPRRGHLVQAFSPGKTIDIVIPGRAAPVSIVVSGYRDGRIVLVLKAEDDIEFEWDR